MPGSEARIKDKLADLTITINAEDWFDIDKPIESNVTVDLGPKLMADYKKLEREFYLQLEQGEIEAVNAATKLGKLLQFASGAAYDESGVDWMLIHKAKIEALRSVVEEAAGMPVLVAYQFKHELARILEAFPQARELDKDPQTIRDWNAGKIPMLVAHPASCGHGLNLQDGGNILCFFGLGFNYEFFAQIIERIGPTRQAQSGHPRPVFVYYIVAKGTADMTVLAALRRKEKVMDFILGRIKNGEETA
jgi:SNF2 family DNA or RNA helicase